MEKEMKLYGLLAEYKGAPEIYQGCQKLVDYGFVHWDAYTPFPVHGLEKAMKKKASRLPWISLVSGLIGGSSMYTFMYWLYNIHYPLIYSGKPHHGWPAFVPPTFELTILFCAFGSLFGMFFLNKLFDYSHPLFSCPVFRKATDDGFFVCIESKDPQFEEEKVKKILLDSGALSVEKVSS
jgi:hypothetical protein